MDVVWFWLILIGIAALFFLVLRYLTNRPTRKRDNAFTNGADGGGGAPSSTSDRSHSWWASSDSGDGGGGDGGGGGD